MEGNISNCCGDDNISVGSTSVVLQLVGKRLYVSVNGVTASEDLSSLSTGGGGGEPGNIPVYTEIPLPVTQNNQTLFTNVVPDDAIVVGIDVGASVFHKGVSFNVINNNKDIQWINTGAPIDINDTVILKVWQL